MEATLIEEPLRVSRLLRVEATVAKLYEGFIVLERGMKKQRCESD
jgi:hypothetical protein